MADAWLSGAGRHLVVDDGGGLRGGAPRTVWFGSDSDPHAVSARSVGSDLVRAGSPAHLVWNPRTGEIVQLLPATRAACLLGAVGREGRACLQVMVICRAADPFTDLPLVGVEALLNWLDAWGVARRWPAGPPLAPPESYDAVRDRRAWARGGHFGASQVPGSGRPDPGGIDVRRLTGPQTPLPRHDTRPRVPTPRRPSGLPGAIGPPLPASVRR